MLGIITAWIIQLGRGERVWGDGTGIWSPELCFRQLWWWLVLCIFQKMGSWGITNQLQEVHTCTSNFRLTCRRSHSPFCAAAGNPLAWWCWRSEDRNRRIKCYTPTSSCVNSKTGLVFTLDFYFVLIWGNKRRRKKKNTLTQRTHCKHNTLAQIS